MAQSQEYKILTVNDKNEEKILRKRTAPFDFGKFSKREINELVRKMREIMLQAEGIGLAANQIGLDLSLFVVQMPRDNRHKAGFYAIFNPRIIKSSSKKSSAEEGCLSVPGGVFGKVERPQKITLAGQDKNGKKIKIKAWGLLARVLQHETDHLNGILFVDRCKELYTAQKSPTSSE